MIRATKRGGVIAMISLTGWTSEEYRERARRAGFDCHLLKPFKMQELPEIINGLE